MDHKYITSPANCGEKTVLLVGWKVEAVFLGPDHANLAEKCTELLNRDEREAVVKLEKEEAVTP